MRSFAGKSFTKSDPPPPGGTYNLPAWFPAKFAGPLSLTIELYGAAGGAKSSQILKFPSSKPVQKIQPVRILLHSLTGGGGGGVTPFETVTETLEEVVVLFEVSLATAVKVWVPFEAVVVFQVILY